jgi:hypothetical protein
LKLTLQERELIKIRNLLEMYMLSSVEKREEYSIRVKENIERAERGEL